MIKKFNLILVLLLLLFVSVSAVSAAADMNDTISSDETILDVSSADDAVLEANSHTITSQNYNSYFNVKTGEMVSEDIKVGDTVYLDGSFSGTNNNALKFVFKKQVNVIGTESNSMKNSVFEFNSGASGSTISNLNIANTYDYSYGIFLNGVSNCVISGCTIKNTGHSSYPICIANNANYNNVTDNDLTTYGFSYGHGSRSTPDIVVSGAHYNYIANNNIQCDDANAVYFSSYAGGPVNGGLSNFNTLYGNTIKFNVLATSWGYAIQTMGTNNTIDSNTIIGGYRGISTSNFGNVIVNNRIINTTGANYNNPGVEVGGEYAIVGAAYSIIRNNTIENAKISLEGSAISVIDYSVVEDNTITVINLGKGINAVGSNIVIRNNKISTQSGSVIFWKGEVNHLTVTGNNITSQSGVGVYAIKESSKKMPGYLTVTDNYIFTGNDYAIDARDVNSSTDNNIDKNIIPKGGGQVGTPEGTYDPTKPRYVFDESNTIVITPQNYNDYIDVNGILNPSIKDGTVLCFEGEFTNKICIYVSSAVKITGNNAKFYNTTFRLSSNGVWIDGITIKNIKSQKENAWGVLAYGINGARISNCDIEVVDPNAAYAIYVVESSDVEVLNNKLSSSGNYLTYTLLAISAEDCTFVNNTITTYGTGQVYTYEAEHCTDGNYSCVDGNCLDGDSCVDGSSVCTDGSSVCADGNSVCTDGDACVDGNSVCADGDSCVDGNTVCTSGNTIPGNHVLKGVFRTYGILMAYSSGCNVSYNKINATSKLNEILPFSNSTNSIVGIDTYYNTHNNVIAENEIYIKAYDNYIYGVGVAGEVSGHPAAEGQGATNNQFINNIIVLEGTYFAQGIVIGPESEDTIATGNIVDAKAINYSYGVNLEQSQKSTLKDNKFTLNSDMVYGIEAFESNDNTIENNDFDIKAKQAYGIAISNSINNKLTANKIMNNVTGEEISYKITDAIGDGVAGVYFKAISTDNIISDNNITSTKGYAIILSDVAVNNTISNNYLKSENGVANHAINNTQNNIVDGNYYLVLDGNMSDIEINYLESAEINVYVSVDGVLVKFYIVGEEIGSAVVSNGVATLTYNFGEDFTPAQYPLTAVVSGDDYSTIELTSMLTVQNGNLDVSVDKVSGNAGKTANVVAYVKDVFGNPVSDINVKFYYKSGRYVYLSEGKSDKNGIVSVVATIPPLNVGTYEILANVTSSDYFNAASANSTIEIKNAVGTKIVFKSSKVYPAGVLAILQDENGNVLADQVVSVTFNDKTTNVTTGSDGSIVLKSTTRGTFDVTVSYAGDDLYQKSSDNSKITFAGAISGNKAYSVYYGNTVTYKVRITGSDGKIVGAGKIVKIKVGRTTYTVKTNAKGYASKALKLKAGTYTVITTYNGDKVSNKITIKPTVITKNLSKKKAKTVKFTAKLVNKKGKILKNKKITFKFKGKKYTAKTNSKGVATLSLKNLKVGKFTITSSYGGCTVSNKITIKK